MSTHFLAIRAGSFTSRKYWHCFLTSQFYRRWWMLVKTETICGSFTDFFKCFFAQKFIFPGYARYGWFKHRTGGFKWSPPTFRWSSRSAALIKSITTATCHLSSFRHELESIYANQPAKEDSYQRGSFLRAYSVRLCSTLTDAQSNLQSFIFVSSHCLYRSFNLSLRD